MNDFKPLDDQLAGLIGALSPAGRRKLAAEIAKELRKSQQQRIKQQKSPDGIPYQARKRQPLRAKSGRIKRAMFAKLRTSRYLKASGRSDAAVVEFTGKVQRIARVHQYGLMEKPGKNSKFIKYPERALLGISEIDIIKIDEIILNFINQSH
ncbi:phage virion morphogenesis protein [Enterobacter cloacae]|nr:phage virion morphogenesis protein [Enterobacter cloacae]